MRSATLTLTNNHEFIEYCYGKDGLGDNIFVPGGRLEAVLDLELNLDASLVEFMKRVRNFEAHDIQLITGVITQRYFKLDLPRVIFDVPAIEVPETGSVPVTFSGRALQSALGAADEVTVSYQ